MRCKDGQKHESTVGYTHTYLRYQQQLAASLRIGETSCRFPKILEQIKTKSIFKKNQISMLGKVLYHYIPVVCNTVGRIQSFLWRIDDALFLVCYHDPMTLR